MRSSLLLLVKLAFLVGSLLIIGPLFLRMADFFDNSAAFTLIAFGIVLVIIAESNRVRMEDRQLLG